MLAAGAATRYGSAKQVELLPSVLAALARTSLTEIIVVEGAHDLRGIPARIVRCPDWEQGPGASVRCGLAALGDDVTHALVVLADGPDLDPRAVDRLLAHATDADVLAASYDGSRSHPVLLARRTWGAVPDEGGRALPATLVDCSDLGAPGDVDVRPLDAADQAQLERVSTLVRDVLGADALGAYLHGSAVLGGLQPTSDLDVLVVSARATGSNEKQRLVDRLLTISGPNAADGPLRRIELTIVVAADVKPWRFPPRFDFQFRDGLHDEFESGSSTPWHSTTSPHLAMHLAMVLHGNTTVFGPPPAELLSPVPHEDLVTAVTGDVEELLERIDDDTRNVILTLARIWCTAATGAIRSKVAAAEWGLERLPTEHRAVLAHARAVYTGETNESWDELRPQVRPYAEHVVAEIERLVR